VLVALERVEGLGELLLGEEVGHIFFVKINFENLRSFLRNT